MSFKVIVKSISNVSVENLSDVDKNNTGYFTVYLDDSVTKDQIANATLDVFYSFTSIDCPDNFIFEVWLDGKKYMPSLEHERNSLVDMGRMHEYIDL